MPDSSITVVIPTVGRPESLRRCLQSVLDCNPAPDEILVIDQSRGPEVRIVVDAAGERVRMVADERRGVGAATNLGLRLAGGAVVAITHDDCTVSRDWIGVAAELMSERPDAIHTGVVAPEPGGEAWRTPSTIVAQHPREFTGLTRCDVLYPNNMVCERARILAFGGYDERFDPRFPAEDNDLCYRWLRSGRAMRFEPGLRVVHRDWRSEQDLRIVHRGYGAGQGAFYAKHLRRRDLTMLRFLLTDLIGSARALGGALIRWRAELAIAPRARLAGLPGGIIRGWRHFSSESSDKENRFDSRP